MIIFITRLLIILTKNRICKRTVIPTSWQIPVHKTLIYLPDDSENVEVMSLSIFLMGLPSVSLLSFPPRNLIISLALSNAVRLDDRDLARDEWCDPMLLLCESLNLWLKDTGQDKSSFPDFKPSEFDWWIRLWGIGVDGDDQEDT